jgi:hypothetical protein
VGRVVSPAGANIALPRAEPAIIRIYPLTAALIFWPRPLLKAKIKTLRLRLKPRFFLERKKQRTYSKPREARF